MPLAPAETIREMNATGRMAACRSAQDMVLRKGHDKARADRCVVVCASIDDPLACV